MAAIDGAKDFRSTDRDFKRSKDNRAKWARGVRNYYADLEAYYPEDGGAKPRQAVQIRLVEPPTQGRRPVPTHWSKGSRRGASPKAGAARGSRQTYSAQEELDVAEREIVKGSSAGEVCDAITTPQGQLTTSLASIDDGDAVRALPAPLYSFDKSRTPGMGGGTTLEVYVKTTGRETDKLIEREWQLLDDNGDVLRGRRARQGMKRKPKDAAGEEDADDFVVV